MRVKSKGDDLLLLFVALPRLVLRCVGRIHAIEVRSATLERTGAAHFHRDQFFLPTLSFGVLFHSIRLGVGKRMLIGHIIALSERTELIAWAVRHRRQTVDER